MTYVIKRYILWYLKHPLWALKWLVLKLSGVKIANSARVSPKSHIQKLGGKIIIGDETTINDDVKIIAQHKGKIVIGRNVSINYGCILYGYGGLEIKDNTRIAANSMFIPMNHEFDNPNLEIRKQPIRKTGIKIGSDVWIGARVTILDGVNIENGSVIGACSLVNKSTVKNGVYVGNPAKFIRRRGEKKLDK